MSIKDIFDADPAEALELDPGFAERFGDQPRPACQLYLISPLETGGDFPARLAEALDAGPVAAFQFRVKGIDQHEAARLAEPLLALCRERDVAFIVNDDMSLAKRIGADGVHLGQGDGDPAEARRVLGPDAQIGVTCHASRHLAMEAAEAGADYVAFGAFFETTTKATEHRADVALPAWWTTVSDVPCVAIGGIDAGNCAPVVAAGADFIAVSSAVWQHPQGPGAGVRALHAGMTGPDAARRHSRE
ncbi:thiamine phosphate synthase [Sphingomonas lacunae]|uniref:Thiamine-phosphate synthase n=1 Tax=Sphingomonas lacunae TaxID=2698828 RepID=A0A6M4AUR7_9SPHN|nr:thiamine phosphate synthase [Sphingomonas lacunae]QJQ32897.1 thiamine phosphate synthase [Sphingomonas lacunae]